ncbi:MAG: hypothetical protein KKA73_09985 [Chloroflexi bacterium]|nr:hypothetical protein [Chloroflexota bacterium]MBU1748006.1 hypothetical protein [Chloroflexota bacterium]
MSKPQKRAKVRKSIPRRKPAAPTSADLSAHEDQVADLAARLLTPEPPAPEVLAAGLDELRAFEAPVAQAALEQLAQEGQALALPLLNAALADEALVASAVLALARVADPAAAQLLDEVARQHPDRAVVKTARKSLFELRRAGIAWEAAPDEAPRDEWPLYKAIASHIDGTGVRSVWIARRDMFGGLRVGNFVLSETIGIKDCDGADGFGQVDFDRIIERGAESDPPLIYAEVGLPHARRLIEEARAINKESGAQLPFEFYTWKDLLGDPQPDEADPTQIDELAPEALGEHPEWLEQAPALLELPICADWVPDEEDVDPYLGRYGLSRLREMEGAFEGVADLGAKQDEGIVVRRAVRELFDEASVQIMQRRLEETALVLWLTGEPEAARWAGATAVALAEDVPQEEIPLLYELVRLGLDRAFALMLDELGPSGTVQELLARSAEAGVLVPGEESLAPPAPVAAEPPKSAGGVYLPK